MANIEITRDTAAKVLEIVDRGLVRGLGNPEPGQMCVEAAVCYALGLPHSDDPKCVAPALRSLKIALNDKNWSSTAARAKGMRRLAIVQLGTAGELDEKAFATAVAEMTVRTMVPIALRAAAKHRPEHADRLEAAALRCEREGTREAADAATATATAYAATATAYAVTAAAAYAAYAATATATAYAAATAAAYATATATAYAAATAAAYAAATAAARDSILAKFAESVVQILVKMGVKSAAFLDLAPMED